MHKKSVLIAITLCLTSHVAGQAMQVSALAFDSIQLMHALVPSGPVPTALDPDGVYPYVSFCETAKRPQPVSLQFIRLENRFIRVTICPDLGGKVTSMIHKASGKEVLYCPSVIRPTRILPRYYFVAGGIEVSFPISHSPSQNEQVYSCIDVEGDRTYITCGERELRFGMQWSVEYSLGPGDRFLTQRTRYYNPGSEPYPWMSWSNAAVPSAPDTEFHFPGGPVLSHSSRLDTLDWATEGPRTESDILEMTGYFWINPEVNAFGVYTPSIGMGLYHSAEKKSAPGMKLWSYGAGEDRNWSILSTSKDQAYVEIQGGPIRDQSIKRELAPKEAASHTEFWFPVEGPADIYQLHPPYVDIRDESRIPMFSWPRIENTGIWTTLLEAYQSGGPLPLLPPVELNSWPPSGMEELGKAFDWAIESIPDNDRNLWYYYYGTWLAGRGEETRSVEMLEMSANGEARALLARLLVVQGRIEKAVEVYRSIREPWIRNHPQLVAERDRVLRALGPETLEERRELLLQVGVLKDEWIIERRVQLLIDEKKHMEAKELLLSTGFQKIHQRYVRTELWLQICKSLNEPCHPLPPELGEDRLSRFGAYREFE